VQNDAGDAGDIDEECANGTWRSEAMADCQPWTVCVAGERVASAGSALTNRTCTGCVTGTFSVSTNAEQCEAWATCSAGSHVSNTPSASENRTCMTCAGGTLTTGDNESECLPHEACDAGTVQTAPGSTSSQPTCEACEDGTYCEGGTAAKLACATATWDHDSTSATECMEKTHCSAGEEVVSHGSATVNRSCLACTGETFTDDVDAEACEPWTVCEAGEEVAQDGAPNADRTCADCVGSYSNGTNADTCTLWTECTTGFRVDFAGSDIADRTCAACPGAMTTTAFNQTMCVADGAPGTCQASAITPGTSLCRGTAVPMTWTLNANITLNGTRGGLVTTTPIGWNNLATSTSFAADTDFCVAYQASVTAGYNQVMAGVRITDPFTGQYLDRGIYLDQLGPCYYFTGTAMWFNNLCSVAAPGAYAPAAGDCALIEVRRAAGTLQVALNGVIVTTSSSTAAATPTVLLYNNVANVRAAYRY
jgi:hypothetical protein